jgi:multiple sugar transport system substrate-binding protein
MKKLLGSTMLFLLMGVSLVACGGNTQEGQAGDGKSNPTSTTSPSQPVKKEGDDKKPVKLTMTIWGDTRIGTYQERAAAYKKINPHVDIEVIGIPFADYQQKLSIMVASKTAPDIAWLAERMVPQFLGNGQLADISEYVKNDAEYDFADIIPSTLEIFKSSNGLYGIPFSTPPQVIFYNKSLFTAKNQKTPMELYKDGKWTYDQFKQTATALSDPNSGVFGSTFGVNTKLWSDYMFGLVWGMGGEVFDEKLTQFKMNTPAGIKALNYYKSLIDTKSHPSIGSQITFDGGKLAMSLENVTNTTKYRDKVNFEWDIAPMPSGDGGLVVPLGFAGYSVFKSDKQKEAASFLKFLTNKENSVIISDFFVPQRKSILYSNEYLNKFAQPSPETMKIAAYDLMNKGRIRPGHSNWVQIDEQIATNFEAFLTGAIPADEALKRMEKSVNPLLK